MSKKVIWMKRKRNFDVDSAKWKIAGRWEDRHLLNACSANRSISVKREGRYC